MTMLGTPYGGNAREQSLSTSQVAARPSKLSHPLMDFETKMFNNLGLFDFDNQFHNLKKYNFITLLVSAFRTSFFQINLSVFSNQKRDPAKLLLHWRINLFIKFIRIILCIRKCELLPLTQHKNLSDTD